MPYLHFCCLHLDLIFMHLFLGLLQQLLLSVPTGFHFSHKRYSLENLNWIVPLFLAYDTVMAFLDWNPSAWIPGLPSSWPHPRILFSLCSHPLPDPTWLRALTPAHPAAGMFRPTACPFQAMSSLLSNLSTRDLSCLAYLKKTLLHYFLFLSFYITHNILIWNNPMPVFLFLCFNLRLAEQSLQKLEVLAWLTFPSLFLAKSLAWSRCF